MVEMSDMVDMLDKMDLVEMGEMDMTRKIFRFLLCATMVLTLAACGDKEPKQTSQGAEEPQSAESTVSSMQTASAESGAENVTSTYDAMELFERFLAGEEKVKKGERDYTVENYDGREKPVFVPYVDDAGYTLKGLVARVQEFDNDYAPSVFTSSVDYGFLDLGDDGEPELLLNVYHNGGVWGEARDYYFIIGKGNDGLRLIYMGINDYFQYSYLANEKGLMISYDYEGGNIGDHREYGYLDPKGEYHKLFTKETYYGMGVGYGLTDGVPAAAERIAAQEGNEYFFDGINFQIYSIGDMAENIYSYTSYNYDGDEQRYERQIQLAEGIISEEGLQCQENEVVEEQLMAYAKQFNVPAGILEEEEASGVYEELTRDDYWPGSIVTVSDVDGMMNAVRDNTMILLEPGTYDVTKWLAGNISRVREYEYDDEYGGNPKAGIFYLGMDEEDYEVFFCNIHNLVLGSADPANPARVVCDAPYSRVIDFDNCSNVSVENVVMGHEVAHGYCAGDVLGFDHSNYVVVNGCDLYGCGVYGLSMYHCNGVSINDSVIHDCTQGCIYATDCYWVSIVDSEFHDCDGSGMFCAYDTTLDFERCSFKNLRGEMLDLFQGRGRVNFGDCLFDAKALNSIKTDPDFYDCVVLY